MQETQGKARTGRLITVCFHPSNSDSHLAGAQSQSYSHPVLFLETEAELNLQQSTRLINPDYVKELFVTKGKACQ